MAEDLTQKFWRDTADCERFSLQLDKSTDTSDTAQMFLFVQMVFREMTAKEELLTLRSRRSRRHDQITWLI